MGDQPHIGSLSMAYYDHAILLAYRLGPWAHDAPERPKAGHQIEAELARDRQAAEAQAPARQRPVALTGRTVDSLA